MLVIMCMRFLEGSPGSIEGKYPRTSLCSLDQIIQCSTLNRLFSLCIHKKTKLKLILFRREFRFSFCVFLFFWGVGGCGVGVVFFLFLGEIYFLRLVGIEREKHSLA